MATKVILNADEIVLMRLSHGGEPAPLRRSGTFRSFGGSRVNADCFGGVRWLGMRGGNQGKQAVTLDYRADIDGLRAVSVVAVILYHLGVGFVPGGFIGVDVFFVISGFVITRSIVKDLERGRFSLLDFFDRRIRRIFPAFAVVMLACIVAATCILYPSDLVQFSSTAIAAAFSLSNFLFARQGGYFAPNAELSPLLHTWSLGVEEQFYLFSPLVMLGVWRWARGWLPLLVWSAMLGSLALSIWGVRDEPDAAFYLLPFRAWELMLGGSIALGLVPAISVRWCGELSAVCGLLMIIAAATLYTADTSFPGFAAMLPCLGAALVIWSGTSMRGRPSWTAVLLSSRWPVFVGLISYSLYLWHWPLIVFAKHLLRTSGLTAPLQIGLVLTAVMLAGLSWRYVEQPMRAGGWPWPSRIARLGLAGTAIAAFALIGVGIKSTKGLPNRLPHTVLELAEARKDFSPLRARCHDGATNRPFHESCVLGASVHPGAVVFADSHGVELSKALGDMGRAKHFSIRQVTASACPPIVAFTTERRPHCAKHVANTLSALAKAEPTTVLLVAHYFLAQRSVSPDVLWSGLEMTVRILRDAGHSVVLLGAVPPHFFNGSIPTALARWVHYGGTPETYRFPIDVKVADAIGQNLANIATAHGAIYVPLTPYLCSGGLCQAYKNNAVMYFDNNHLSVAGARTIANDVLLPIIEALIRVSAVH